MKKQRWICIIILFLHIFAANAVYGQKEGNIWYFGDHAGITFNTSPPSLLTDNKYSNRFGTDGIVTHSDATGKLQFIVAWDTVYDRNWNVMAGGEGPKWGDFPSLITPSPNDTNQYYVFSRCDASNSRKLFYCIVDMSMNGGLGGIAQPFTLLVDSMWIELGCVPHTNGRDIWVVTHAYNTGDFLSYLITGSGISAPVVSTTGFTYTGYYSLNIVDCKFNPKGNCFMVNENVRSTTGQHLFHFDRSTGKLTSWLGLFQKKHYLDYGEFSPDGSKLYGVKYDSIFQYDLSSGDSATIMRSFSLIASDNINYFGYLMLGPDGRIYVGQSNTHYLGVIENPNAPANQVIYNQRGVYLGDGINKGLLPLQPVFGLLPKAGFTYNYNCFGDSVYFKGSSSRQPAKYFWNFGDTLSSNLDTVTGPNPVHYYARPGKYAVMLVADVNGFKDTAVQIVEVKVSAFSLGPDTTLCAGQSYTLSAAMPYVRYMWSTGDTTGSIQAKTTGTYWIKAYTSTCARYDTVKLKFVDVRTDLGKDTSICRNGSVTLDAGIDSVSYLWSTGETTRTISAAKAGTYRVAVQRAACIASDSIIVKQAPEPVKVVPESFYLCPDLKETQSVDAGSAKSYLWQPSGYTGRIFIAQDTGLYMLTTTNGYGCMRTDTFKVIRQCPPTLQIPTAFTPNNDSLNQTFIPVGLDIETFEMYVYDRWGEIIYHTTSFDKGWDGTFKGNPCPEGLYFYKLKCTGYGRPEKTIIRQTGRFYLLR